MQIARGAGPVLVGVHAELGLEHEPATERVAPVGTARLARRVADEQLVEDLVVRELVISRKRRVRFRSALVLRNLRKRLVGRAQLRISLVNRLPVERGPVIHQPVRGIAIVRDRERLKALSPDFRQPCPQVLGILGVDRGERRGRVFALEDHVAMQVLPARHRGPFISDERGELARLVVRVGGVNLALPGRGGDFGGIRAKARATGHQTHDL